MENNDILAELGYCGRLCILPFDHRSFFEELLKFKEPLTEEQKNQLTDYKKIIYGGYEKALILGVPAGESAILVDDEFGLDILTDAKKKGYFTLQSTEVSGDTHFEFAHGNDWQEWIEKVQPTFVKALVRYNADGDDKLNAKSLAGLKKLSNYAHEEGYKFLIEPLVPATDEQLSSVDNDKKRYDAELRPMLTVKMIFEMQEAGVEPDIWKIEGFAKETAYEEVVAAARAGGRDHVGVISLGRNETDEIVEGWLRAGSHVKGVIGFAVGRTIFLDSLLKFQSGEFTRELAMETIAERFKHFYDVFTKK
ncbi:MAG: 5-keto-2-deoxygluconokinase [Patescibacteria group bacterium]|nr:5-keto-2-deoxygluconokinase [Patescibacteria group bacterium]